MKKLFILPLLVLFMISGIALAEFDQGHILLKEYDLGTSLVDFSLTSGSAKFSATIDTQHNAGFAALLIKEDKAGGAGDVDVSVEYSIDGSNWYTAYTQDATTDTATGFIQKEGLIVPGIQNDTWYVTYTPRVGRYLRYKFDPDADSRITATHIFVNDE